MEHAALPQKNILGGVDGRGRFLSSRASCGATVSLAPAFGWLHSSIHRSRLESLNGETRSASPFGRSNSMRVSVNKASMVAAATLAVLVLTNVADAGVS